MKITRETRRMAYDEILETLGPRYRAILEELKESGEATARELAVSLWQKGQIPTPERNFVHPRLTELMTAGIVQAVDKKICGVTGKTVAVYAMTAKAREIQTEPEQGQLQLWSG